MGLLTEKYNAWAKHPEKYTAEQVLLEIVSDLKWLDEEQKEKVLCGTCNKFDACKDCLDESDLACAIYKKK